MTRLVTLAGLLMIAALAPSARAGESWSTPHPGISHLFKTTGNPLHIHGMVVDLCQPGVSVRTTAIGEKKRTTSSFGKLVEGEAAINGDFFSYENYMPIGYAAGGGTHWPGTGDSNWQSLVAFGHGHAHFSPESEIFSTAWWTSEALSGFAQIMKEGEAVQSYSCSGHFCQKHPRTAVGLSRDRRTLYLLVVDGRTDLSIGVTLKELANIMKDLGAWDAVNLDGGGSTTMWIAGKGVVNNPSDGSERVVSNHLAVQANGAGQPWNCNEWPPEQVMIDAGLFDSAGSTDVDGDGLGDFCGRAAAGLLCLRTGPHQLGATVEGPHPELSDQLGWKAPDHYGAIHMGDISGDALADLCARGNSGMRCWLSQGESFAAEPISGPEWSNDAGWDQASRYSTIRMADIDGDGLADLCGRGPEGIQCHRATGNGFQAWPPGPALSDAGGWGDPRYFGTIRVGDFNGDGMDDLCARAAAGMRCYPSAGGPFGPVVELPFWSDAAGFAEMRYWATIRMADIDGDGLADLCARGPNGIECYLADGESFGELVPGPELSDATGWHDQTNYLPIRWGDINGDGRSDLCARADAGYYCWPSLRDNFGPAIAGPAMSDENGWFLARRYNSIRLADVDGDGLDDLCALKSEGVKCWLSDGAGFPTPWIGPAWSDANGWSDIGYWASVRMATPRKLSPCMLIGACTPGAAEEEPCGQCGISSRFCSENCEWSDWSSCWSKGRPAEVCDDGNPCTDDLCGTDGQCASSYNQAPCDDGNPCTGSACQAGSCTVTGTLPDCCTDDTHCDPPFAYCEPQFSLCRPVLCRACVTHDDCRFDGNLCLSLGAQETFCGALCDPAADNCPAGFTCTSFGPMPAQCIPLDGSCGCQPHSQQLCHQGDLYWADSCGNPQELATECDGFGCDDGACRESGAPGGQDATASPENGDGDYGGSGGNSGGCTAATGASHGSFWLMALLLGLVMVIMKTKALRKVEHPSSSGRLGPPWNDQIEPRASRRPSGKAQRRGMRHSGAMSRRRNADGRDASAPEFTCLFCGRPLGPLVAAAMLLLLAGCGAGGVGGGEDGRVVLGKDGSGPEEEVRAEFCVEGQGCLGTPCENSLDCPSGWCVDHLGQQLCSVPCDGKCPSGWICGLVAQGTAAQTQVCLSLHPTLCLPCTSSFDCMRIDGLKGHCLDLGPAGSFCGAACDSDKACPDGYACQEETTVEGDSSLQCVATTGTCQCTATAVAAGLSVPCQITNGWGTCPGQAKCTSGGPGPCVGPMPMPESCNGLDDDCDGDIDEVQCDQCSQPGACTPGEMDEEADSCGPDCSITTRSRKCSATCLWEEWSPWSACSPPGQGQCEPGESQDETAPCGGCQVKTRQRKCGEQCIWGSWGSWSSCFDPGTGQCQPGQTEEEIEPCDGCSQKSRSRQCTDECSWGPWGAWSPCQGGGGICQPGEQQNEEQGCGNCGKQKRTRLCTDGCQWGNWSNWGDCTGQGECAPGKTEEGSQGCGNCGTQKRNRTCTEGCIWGSWGSWGDCTGQGVCAPGQTGGDGCDKCAQRTCQGNCQWGECALKPGAGCLWKEGKNWKCCAPGKWHFCLPSNCNWSSDCSPCTGCGC